MTVVAKSEFFFIFLCVLKLLLIQMFALELTIIMSKLQ